MACNPYPFRASNRRTQLLGTIAPDRRWTARDKGKLGESRGRKATGLTHACEDSGKRVMPAGLPTVTLSGAMQDARPIEPDAA